MRKTTFLLSVLLLTACGESDSSVSTTDFHPWNENEFTISTPAGYERIVPGQSTLELPNDFIAGYSEVRLDDNFATTVSIHREALSANITSETYSLALRDSVSNATDYTELSFSEDENGAYLHQFKASSEVSGVQPTFTQRTLVNNSQGWIISCATTSDQDPCPQIASSFSLK